MRSIGTNYNLKVRLMRGNWRRHFVDYGGWYFLGLLLACGCATPTRYVQPQNQTVDNRKSLPHITPPKAEDPIQVVFMDDPGPPAQPMQQNLTVHPTVPAPADASVGQEIDPSKVDTVLVDVPEVAPPTSGLSHPEYNAYAAAVERGFMDAGCKVVDRRRLERLREEWRLREADAQEVDPEDTIALGRLLNARIVVFAENLSASTEQVPLMYRTRPPIESAWRPKAIWVEEADAENSDWDIDWEESDRDAERDWTGIDPWNQRYTGSQGLFSTRHRSLFLYDTVYFQLAYYARNSTGGLTTTWEGYRIANYEHQSCQLFTWRFASPGQGIYQVWEPPNSKGFDVIVFPDEALGPSESAERARCRVFESYAEAHLPERRQHAICDGGRAVIVSEAQLRWFRARVKNPEREAAGFVALPVFNDDGTIQYEPTPGGGGAYGVQYFNLPVCTVQLTAKIVIVETSEVAWIGTSRLGYTDILNQPVPIPIRENGPDSSAWPSLDRQRSEILARIFSHTAEEFLSRIREAQP